MQQKHGIRAARYSHAHALPGFGRREVEHAMSRNESGYAVEHSVRMIPRREGTSRLCPREEDMISVPNAQMISGCRRQSSRKPTFWLTSRPDGRTRGVRIRYHESVSKAPPDVFISYSTDARPWAEKLSESLESKGISTWADFKSIMPGQQWRKEIQRALDDAKYFLIVVGPKNQIGEWQDREWQGALQRTWADSNTRIIPVLINDATPPSFLKNWVFVRMQPGKPESSWIDRIYDAVRGTGSRRLGALPKQSAKPNKALQIRLEGIESFAKQLKSNQEQ